MATFLYTNHFLLGHATLCLIALSHLCSVSPRTSPLPLSQEFFGLQWNLTTLDLGLNVWNVQAPFATFWVPGAISNCSIWGMQFQCLAGPGWAYQCGYSEANCA